MYWLSRCVVVVAIVSLAAAGGCSKKDVPSPGAESHPGQSSLSLQSQVDTALRIPTPQARDATLQRVAQDAAASGQADVCATAIGKITSPDQRKSTAAGCSTLLKQAGNAAGADKAAAAGA